MAAPALRNTIYSEFPDRAFDEDNGEFEREEFFTGERLCPPRPRRSGLSKLFSWLVILGALYGGWSLWRDRPAWLQTVATDAAALWSALNPKDAPPPQRETASDAAHANPPEQAVSETEIADAPGAEAGTAFETVTTAAADAEAAPTVAAESNAQPEAADGGAAPPAAAAPQATPPRRDRLEKQAEAVGLNPDLSKSLLKRLTEADFRNAAIAIKTALAETAESAIYTWPAKPKPNLALFEVRFVPGAAENCRRYVVTVTKDRWSTTAPPMEKCGVSSPGGVSDKS